MVTEFITAKRYNEEKSNYLGYIHYTFVFEAIAEQNKKHPIRLIVENFTNSTIEQLTVLPSLTTDDYRFSSLPNNWSFYNNENGVCSSCISNTCNHKIIGNVEINPDQKKEFEFKILFLQPKKTTKLKIDLISSIDGVNVSDKSESLVIQVESKTKLIWREFSNRLLDALLIAFLIFVFDYIINHYIPEDYKIYIIVIVLGITSYYLPKFFISIKNRIFGN